jgi:hypothetical protein
MNYGSIRIFGRWQLFLIMLSATIVNVAVAQKTANAPESESAASAVGDSPGIVGDSPTSDNSVAPEDSAAQVASSEASVQTECVPQCRSGFMCRGGLCVSKCNPPCAEGQMCTVEGECMAAVAPPPTQSRASVAPAQQNARLALYAERQQILDERFRERLAYRNKLRLTLFGTLFACGASNYSIIGGGFQFGVRKQVAGKVAFHGRASFFVGGTTDYDVGLQAKNVLLPGGDVAALFGPFGRFYFGPLLWLQGEIVPSKETVTDSYGDTYEVKNHIRGGFGGELGVLLGKHEHVDLNLRLKSEFDMAYSNFVQAEFGVGFHFFPGD